MKREQYVIFIVALGATLLFGFQNCGKVKEPSLFTKTTPFVFAEYYHYPYADAPEVYGQVQLATTASTAKFSDVQYIAVFGRADGDVATYDYELDIVNESDYPVCPARVGTAAAGATSIVGGCLSQTQSREVRVILKLKSAGKNYEFKKTYTSP